MSVALQAVPLVGAASGRPVDSRVELLELFAACVAHELRTPLATQRALLELALGDPGLRVAGWREIGAEVLDACLRQARLLEACVGLARARSGPRRRERVDLAVVAAEVLEAQEPDGLERVAVLEPAWVVGDPVLLRCLAANVVSNAVRHNVSGGRIDVTTRGGRGRSHLAVANTGAPVPAGELRRLFEPFERLVADGEGVGLGLTIVQAVAEAHRARVCVQARAGGGLELDVAFPAAPGPDASSDRV